jgi:hypothetical protein
MVSSNIWFDGRQLIRDLIECDCRLMQNAALTPRTNKSSRISLQTTLPAKDNGKQTGYHSKNLFQQAKSNANLGNSVIHPLSHTPKALISPFPNP